MTTTPQESIKVSIRNELEATRTAFHTLLQSLSDTEWRRKSGYPVWTVGEVMVHLTLVLRELPNEIEAIRRGKRITKPPPAMFERVTVWLARVGAWRQTRDSVARKYDTAHAAMMVELDCIQQHEWLKRAHYPKINDGPVFPGAYVTIEILCRFPSRHFTRHLKDIREGLGG